jgi:hypothetical protein
MRRNALPGGLRKARRRLILAALAAVVPAAGLMAGDVAHADTMRRSDPSGDTGPAFDGRGDVVEVAVSNAPPVMVASVRTQVFDDPASSPNWTNGASAIVFGLNVDADGATDFTVHYGNSGFGPFALVVSAGDGSVVCGAWPTSDAATSEYSVTIESACLGEPLAVAVNASFQYFDEWWNMSVDETDFTAPATIPATSTTTTTTTVSEPATTTTTVPAVACKPGNGWGDVNHVHCGVANTGSKSR